MSEPSTLPVAPESEGAAGAASAFALLERGVPLSLLLDLAGAIPSSELYREEPGDTGWLTAVSA